MSTSDPKNIDEAVKECHNCGKSVLEAYIEDGLCHQCRDN